MIRIHVPFWYALLFQLVSNENPFNQYNAQESKRVPLNYSESYLEQFIAHRNATTGFGGEATVDCQCCLGRTPLV